MKRLLASLLRPSFAAGLAGAALTAACASLCRSSPVTLMHKSIAISLATFPFMMVHVLCFCNLALWP